MLTLNPLTASDIVPGLGGLSVGDWIFVVANLIIPLGYFFVALKVLPILPVSKLTKHASRAFFILCAFTHIEQTVHTVWFPEDTYREAASEWHMLLIHVPQAIAVWVFAVSFFFDLKRLSVERRGTHRAVVVPNDQP